MDVLFCPIAYTVITVLTAMIWGEMRYKQGYLVGTIDTIKRTRQIEALTNIRFKAPEIESDLE